MIDRFATTIAGSTGGLPINTLSIRTFVCNGGPVFSRVCGAVTRRVHQAGCSRQTIYEHARQLEHRL